MREVTFMLSHRFYSLIKLRFTKSFKRVFICDENVTVSVEKLPPLHPQPEYLFAIQDKCNMNNSVMPMIY